jgi:3-phenylpropionate/trans-cinnamate dioxygenase ferredoxin subunit
MGFTGCGRAMGTSYVVARAAELPPGTRKIVEIAGRSIAVFNIGGELYALRNRCPHQGGPLCSGYQFGALSASTPGEYAYERAGEIIRCPWHGWEFDIRTGQSWFDPARMRVRSYPVSVRSGQAVAGRVPGPYVAETYPVRVADECVVVEV